MEGEGDFLGGEEMASTEKWGISSPSIARREADFVRDRGSDL